MKQSSLMKAALIGGALSLTSMSAVAGTPDAAAQTFAQSVAAAQAEIDKAAKAGFEWRDSRKFLKKADAAAKAGDMAKANKLVAKAKAQGVLAQKQAKDQANPTWHF